MSGETILVVDDDADIQMTVRLALEISGYKVMEGSNAKEAFDAIAKCTPDLILLDVSLPLVSGWQLLEKIRSIPGLDETPVVITTAHVGNEVSRRATQLGASDYLAKPFDVEALSGLVRRLLAARKNE